VTLVHLEVMQYKPNRHQLQCTFTALTESFEVVATKRWWEDLCGLFTNRIMRLLEILNSSPNTSARRDDKSSKGEEVKLGRYPLGTIPYPLQCFDTVGWVTKDRRSVKISYQQSQKVLLWETWLNLGCLREKQVS